MIDRGRHNVIGVHVNAVDYEAAVARIIAAAKAGQYMGVTALAVHGVMTGVMDKAHRRRLNCLDLVVPDGQPVRWALNLLHGTKLADRVYGPTLTLKTCEAAAAQAVPVYFYGSKDEVVKALIARLSERYPALQVVGYEASKFRQVSAEEQRQIAERIQASGARIVFAGLGCPRQEVWAYEHRDLLAMPVLAVGAAFDFHAGLLPQAPPVLQRLGLEWAYRLVQEPKRLWRRYLYLNPYYVSMVALQVLRLRRFDDDLGSVEVPPQRYS